MTPWCEKNTQSQNELIINNKILCTIIFLIVISKVNMEMKKYESMFVNFTLISLLDVNKILINVFVVSFFILYILNDYHVLHTYEK